MWHLKNTLVLEPKSLFVVLFLSLCYFSSDFSLWHSSNYNHWVWNWLRIYIPLSPATVLICSGDLRNFSTCSDAPLNCSMCGRKHPNGPTVLSCTSCAHCLPGRKNLQIPSTSSAAINWSLWRCFSLTKIVPGLF